MIQANPATDFLPSRKEFHGYSPYTRYALLCSVVFCLQYVMDKFSLASKFNPDWQFLCQLRDAGREVTEALLEQNYDAIGKHSTADLREELQSQSF